MTVLQWANYIAAGVIIVSAVWMNMTAIQIARHQRRFSKANKDRVDLAMAGIVALEDRMARLEEVPRYDVDKAIMTLEGRLARLEDVPRYDLDVVLRSVGIDPEEVRDDR